MRVAQDGARWLAFVNTVMGALDTGNEHTAGFSRTLWRWSVASAARSDRRASR
jgi:hypothetical protein